MKKVVIIGAGPAGLTAAYELIKTGNYDVTVFEKTEYMGGISRTVNHNGNRMDMGGHRFFSKDEKVNSWWQEILPLQGALSYDDLTLSRPGQISEGGPDPEKDDSVMLVRNRVSRIFFDGKFYDYPISLKASTFFNMGLKTTAEVAFSYLHSALFKREEKSLEDFYINRFGRKLYSMFFENYTENLWGRHPSEISPDWGAQRVKGVSLIAVLKDALGHAFHIKSRQKETSLIESFYYPKFGPGQLWETVAGKALDMGLKLVTGADVTGIHNKDGIIDCIEYEKDGERIKESCDILLSSAPLKNLTEAMNDVPDEVRSVASALPYRDYMTLGVLIKNLSLVNKTKIPTVGNIVPDNWVYVHNKSVRMGRFQIYNNWSPYLVKDLENTVWLGLEYFTNEGDDLWEMSDSEFETLATDEMLKLGLISDKSKILDSRVERVEKAYPAYFDSYKDIDRLISFIDGIDNLYCIGRNGQHRYNNMDHSMITAFEAVYDIENGIKDKSNIWNVNTEKEYHEKS